MATGEPIAILPLGSTEQHGDHLPPETDSIIAGSVARLATDRLRGRLTLDLLPVETVGYAIEHGDDPRTVSLGFAEAAERWIAIGTEARSRGIRKFVMLNAHGGNSPLMTVAATELRVRSRMLAVATAWTRFGWPEGLIEEEEQALGIHGGQIETSVMLALAPGRVAMDRAASPHSAQADYSRRFRHLRAYGRHSFGWKMRDLNPSGVVGNAAAASAELGRHLLDHTVNGFCELLEDVDRFDPDAFD